MKSIYLAIFALALAGCAAQTSNSSAPAAATSSGFSDAQSAALFCFDAIMSGDGEGYYDRCVLKNIKGVIAEVRKNRWMRVAKAAAIKVGQAGGVINRTAVCRDDERSQIGGMVCDISYQLAHTSKIQTVSMPLVREQDSHRWFVLR